MHFARSLRSPARRQRGAVAILVAVLLFVLLGTAAFALDIGRWLVVKNELQNASDAAALAGAGYLFPPVAGEPNWGKAVAEADLAIPLNGSEKIALSTGDVIPGYWDFANRVFNPDTAKVKTNDDLPAVKVTITRKPGENMGSVSMLFGRLFGVDSIDAAATAVAAISAPASIGPGVLAPIAVSKCMVESGEWDDGQKFAIASGAANGNHCNGCNCGQWTTFEKILNNVPSVRDLLDGGNNASLAVSDDPNPPCVEDGPYCSYIQPGVESTLYDRADLRLSGKDILVPIVDNDVLGDKGFTPIRGWACVHVYDVYPAGNHDCSQYKGEGPLPGGYEIDAEGNPLLDKKGEITPIKDKCLIVSFSPDPCKVGNSEGGGGGPFTGVYVPPRLVQ